MRAYKMSLRLLVCLLRLYLGFPAERVLGRLICEADIRQRGPLREEEAPQQLEEQQPGAPHWSEGTRQLFSSSNRAKGIGQTIKSSSGSSSLWTCSSSDGELSVQVEAGGMGEGVQQGAEGVGSGEAAGGALTPTQGMHELPAAAPFPERKPPSAPADVPWLFTVLAAAPSRIRSVVDGAGAGGGAGGHTAEFSEFKASSLSAAAAQGAGIAAFAPAAGLGLSSLQRTAAATASALEATPATAAAPDCTAETALGVPACYPGPATLPQLLLVIELIRFFWPERQEDDAALPWVWLLLLAGLLQQSSVEVRQQLMEQRGSLLLQLLYHALLKDEALGGPGIAAFGSASFAVVPSVAARGLMARIVGMWEQGKGPVDTSGNSLLKAVKEEVGDNGQNPSVHLLVLMVLQSLVYEPLPLELARVPVEQLQGMILLPKILPEGEHCLLYV